MGSHFKGWNELIENLRLLILKKFMLLISKETVLLTIMCLENRLEDLTILNADKGGFK